MTRSEKIEEAARAMLAAMGDYWLWNGIEHEADGCPEDDTCDCPIVQRYVNADDALRAALALPVEPVASECSMCGVLEARIEELKDEVTRMQARVEGAWQAGHDAHVRIEQATIEALRDRVHWLEGHALALPEEPSASGGDATKEEP